MRKAAIAFGILLATSTAAWAEEPGGYISLGAGLNFLQDSDYSGPGTSSKAGFDTGWGGTVAGGWAFNHNWRAELELGLRHNDVSSMRGSNAVGEVGALSLMGNVLYDITTGSKWTPYVGLGAGAVRFRPDGVEPTTSTTIHDSDTVFGYQGLIGIAYDLSPFAKLTLNYHYLRTLDPSVPDTAGNSIKSEYASHLITIGFRFSLEGKSEEAAPPAQMVPFTPAAQPQPAAAAPITRSFQVFFDFNKADIRPDARPIIEQAADNARRGGVSRITLTGHTDRAGSTAYNQRLSEQRAEAVKAELVRMGFSPDQIATIGKGESDPLVPTADGVREPRNRSVEIVF